MAQATCTVRLVVPQKQLTSVQQNHILPSFQASISLEPDNAALATVEQAFTQMHSVQWKFRPPSSTTPQKVDKTETVNVNPVSSLPMPKHTLIKARYKPCKMSISWREDEETLQDVYLLERRGRNPARCLSLGEKRSNNSELGRESLAVRLDEVNQPIGGGVVTADGVRTSQLWLNDLSQLFPQLHSG